MANRDFKVRHGLNVCGNSSLGGDVAISGNLTVGGSLSLNGADLGDSLQVSGSASLGSLKVAGMTSLQGGLVVDTSMDVQTALQANNISASGQLQVDGTTSLKGALTVSGTTSLQGGLIVGGESDFQAKLSANNISSQGHVRVDGQISAGGSILAGQTLRAGGNLCGQGNAFVNQNLRVTQNTDLNGTLTVCGATTLSSTLEVKGTTTLSGDVQAKGNLSVGGDLIVSGALQVGGSGGSDFSVDSPATFADTLTVSGMTSLQGGLVVDTSMDVQTTLQANDISSSGTLYIGASSNPHIELQSNTSGTPYIDFGRQVGGQAQDYGGRIILDGDTTLSICAQQLHFGAQNICLNGTVRATGDVCMQTVGYANQGFRAGLSAGAVGQYDTILVGTRRGAQGTGDGYASITMSPGAFGAKMDATTSFWSVWTNKNQVADTRIKANFGTSTESIRLRPRGQDVLVASSTSAGVRSVAICGSLGVSGATSLGSLKVAGTTSLQGQVDINQQLIVGGYICAVQGLHAVGGAIQTSGTISGTQLKFVSAGGQRMTVSNLDSVSGRVGTLSATKFNFTSAGGQRINISSATITSLNVSTITVNQQGNIARRISGTVASNNSSYVTAFTVVGNSLASCVEVFFEGTIGSVVVACYAEIIVNHSGDITIRTHQGNYTPLDIQVISNGDEDFAVLVKRNGGVAGTANLKFNVYPKGDETVTATATNPYSTTTFTHTGVRGTKITATGGNTHRFETDGEIIGKQTLTVSGMTSLQGGLVVDTSMDVQTKLNANDISSSGALTVQGSAYLSGGIDAKSTLSVGGATILSGAVQAKNTLCVGGSQTIAGQTFDNGWFKIGNSTAGIAMDPNEIYFAGAAALGTLSGNLRLTPTGAITTGKDFDSTGNIQTTAVISGTQLRCTSFAGTTADVAGTLQVSGSASLGSLKVAGATCAQGQAFVTGTLALRQELDFIGGSGKNVNFMLVSSNASTFTANFRSMDHNSQNHHTHIQFVRAGAVNLYHNNNVKAATRPTGFYVSGTLCATQDVKVAGQLRAAGAVSVDGSGHIAQTLQVGGQVSVGGQLIVTQSICANGHVIAGDNATGRIGLSINDGYGNANVTFNHHTGVPDFAGNAARIETNVDATTSSFITLEVGSGLQADVAQALQTAATFYSNRTEINGELQALGNASVGGTLTVSGGGTFKSGLTVSGTLSARKYSFEPYGVVPAYSNSNYETITYNSAESAIELRSGSDTTIGMAFPAWKPNANPGNKWQITMQIRASAATANGVYIRVYEYDAELPDGKIAVSNDATNALVQEDTRHNTTGLYENQPGSTDWQSVTIEYTPTSTAVWASIVVLNWSGLGTNALYVREPQIHEILENVNVGSNVQVAGHVSADGYGHFGTSLQVSGSACLGALKVNGTTCLQGQALVNNNLRVTQNVDINGALQVSGSASFVGSIQAKGGISVGGSGTIAGVSFDKGHLRIGNATAGIAMDPNEIYFAGAGTLGTISGNLNLSPAGQIIAGSETMTLQTLDATTVQASGTVSCETLKSAGSLQVSGTACLGALKVAGMISAQQGIVIDTSFDCQIVAQMNNISSSGQVRVDGQISAQGSILAGQTLRAGGNLCAQGNAYINQTLRVTQGTQLQGGLGVQGTIGLTGELDFNGATDKYVDFMLVSSNASTFTANIRSMNHQSQGHHTHLVLSRGGAVDLYHNNNLKAATRSGGFYVSGTLSVVQDVKAGGQVRAGGALSCAGSGHFSQGVQVSGTVSCNGLHAAAGAIQTTGVISGTQLRTTQFQNSGTTTLSSTLNVTNAGNPNIEIKSTGSGFPLIDFGRAVNGTVQDYGVRLVLRGDDQFDISGAAVRIGQNTTIANGLQVVQGISCGGQLKAAGSCSVDGGGHFGQGVQVSGTVSCTGLHAAGGQIQTTGAISGGQLLTGGQVLATGKIRGTQVCAQAQCLVNNQLRVSQGSIFNGTVSLKNANGTTHWNGGSQRRSVIHRNDGGNYWLLITGQQTAANVSWNSWRPWYVSLSNGENFFRRKIHADAISSNSNIGCVGTISASARIRCIGQICSQDQLRSTNAVVCQGNLHVSGTSSLRGTVLMRGALNVCGKYTGTQISCHNIKAQSGNVCQFNSGGGDFAEYFEWLDGNPNVSDRVGRSVVLTGPSGKISIATDGQTPFGVVTGRAGFVGNSATREWKNRYLRDDYLRIIKDENGKRIVNPDYNSACTYVNRKHRKEWTTIGLVGKVPVRVGEVINPNWMKLRVLTPTVEEYLVR